MIAAAWISSGEVLLVLLVGLLLFGGRLPEVAKDIGRFFIRMRRSLEELRRESGLDETLRDLERETRDIRQPTLPRLPGRSPEPGDAQEPKPPRGPGKSRGEPGEKPGSPRDATDSEGESPD